MDYKALQGSISTLNERLLRGPISDAAFAKTLKALLDTAFELGVWISATVSDPMGDELCTYETGKSIEGSPVDSRHIDEGAARLHLRHSRASSCRLDARSVDDLARSLGELALRHWAARDQGTLLPRLQDPGMPERVLQSVQEMVNDARFLAVVHADLDKFKTVNDSVGEEAGDAVIRAFADRLRNAFSDLGLVVRKGGEEFSAFLIGDDPVIFFERTESFRLRMQNEPLPAIDRPNTCSIGLAVYVAADLPANLVSTDRLLARARQAERRAKEEGRNRIRLPKADEAIEAADSVITLNDLRRSALACRVSLDSDEAVVFQTPFARAVARLLAQKLSNSRLDLTSIGSLIDEYAATLDVSPVQLSWAALELSAKVSHDGWPEPLTPLMPTPVWAAIVARALLSATFRHGSPLTPQDVLELRVSSAESTIKCGASSELWLDVRRLDSEALSIRLGPVTFEGPAGSVIKIGRPWYPADAPITGGIRRARVEGEEDLMVSHEPLSPCLLMPIGDTAIREAKTIASFVAGLVEVDDRPVRGGGLPDFWQSNLGRIVRECLRNPNITRIVAIGEEDGASQTISMLKLNQEGWNERLPDLQRRLSIGADHLGAFRKRGFAFEIVPSGGSDLLEAVVGSTASEHLGDPRTVPTINLDLEMARRRLAVPPATASNQLSINDGLRCKTLADAYPQAIQLLRSSNEPPQKEPTRRTFQEFPCFKLVLTQPFQDEVPDYWFKEQSSIEEYVSRNFTSPEGLFGKRLVHSGSQTQATRAFGVSAAVSAVKEKRPTRRIMLPVATGDELDQPLGLSMIQVLPREREGKWYLDFQWIWRTVEVLVGFPFSAIGSIRWSEQFFRSVKEQLDADGYVDRLELGQLTYVALSFHMFLDIGDREIARAIVQDATR
ncbi:GGDEF domain-containing protein [Methylocystis iwaonis]|uniref:GGDEF domain-containing protein n=1 Tax=Methylocystis iwaonis TaxID=2885079 RepID=UPI002E7ACF26|nr:GGDEF domain-containing protein [Methylocystis iwaonis]